MNEIIEQIVKYVYKKTSFYQKDIINSIILEPPKFYKPTADIDTLVCWNRILSSAFDWVPNELKKALNSSLVARKEVIEKFDFGKIQTLTHSKGFGEDAYFPKINGSWFKDAASWGAGMFPGYKLSGLDDDDWRHNIYHIEGEGFSKTENIKIYYYEWLDRYIAIQSGGSHHAAMLIHQIHQQKRSYYRSAELTRYKLNTQPIKEIADKYSMFITTDVAYLSPIIDDLNIASAYAHSSKVDLYTLLKNIITERIYTIDIKNSVNNAIACFLPYAHLKMERSVFDNWYKIQLKRGCLIPFIDFMAQTSTFCTTPYLHEVRDIYLGDPSRENDIAAKKHSIGTYTEKY